MKYIPIYDGDSYIINTTKKPYQAQCCDCGLVHTICYEIIDKHKLRITTYRNNRSTGQVRRWKKNQRRKP